MMRLAMAMMVGVSLASAATAQSSTVELKSVLLDSPKDDASNTTCQAVHASALAAAGSAFRYNRVALEQNDPNKTQLLFNVYINAMEINNNNKCVYSLTAGLQTYQSVFVEAVQMHHVAKVELCRRGKVSLWDRHSAQTMLNDTIREYVDECLVEYSKYAKPELSRP